MDARDLAGKPDKFGEGVVTAPVGDASVARDIAARGHRPDAGVDGTHAPLDIGRLHMSDVLWYAQIVPLEGFVVDNINFPRIFERSWSDHVFWMLLVVVEASFLSFVEHSWMAIVVVTEDAGKVTRDALGIGIACRHTGRLGTVLLALVLEEDLAFGGESILACLFNGC